MNARFFRLLLCASAALSAAELKDVKSVYLYPMVGGLDQYLASRLTQNHLFRVVADPKLADAVFTDQLGSQLEYRMDRLKRIAPAPASPTSAAPAPQPAPQSIAIANATGEEPHASSFSRGKGTVFLVDAQSRQVVWSSYRKPKNNSSPELERTARRLTADIEKTLAPPPDAARQ